jgi:RNA polymerase sigma-70 factor (ECF subfamily)
VLQVLGSGDQDARKEVLAALCRDYWYPLYAFARRSGRSPEDAEDLTQGFFAYAVEHEIFSLADRNLGTLRTFLLKVFQRYIGNVQDRDRAKKRGGGQEIFSLNLENGEELYSDHLAGLETPELLFDRSWAQSILRASLTALGDAERSAGRGQQFELLQPFLSPETVSEECYEASTSKLGLSLEAVRQAVCRLRKKFRQCLRDQIAATLSDANDARIDEELRALKAALSK